MKIEIDVSERSLEEQIEAAAQQWANLAFPVNGPRTAINPYRDTLRDFAAGKFARAPMPEIVKPKWATFVELRNYDGNGNVYVTAHEKTCFGEGASADGPVKPTAREAILAFNELFGGAS